MTKIKAVNGAGKAFYANHLAANDYYSEDEKVSGIWQGKMAYEFLLMNKEVDTETFSLFQRNIDPLRNKKLTQRTVMTGVRFFDFQCAAPKSVSVMSLWDERLIEAHKTAVAEAMTELEKLAAVRVRKGDNVRTNNLDITGKIVYASFTHDASRALDPQLHTHNVVVNVTKDAEGKYKALESLEMCRAIRYAGKVYHNRLAQECRTLGYKLRDHRDEKGNIVWKDIEGVPEDVMELFSKRRQQIEEEEAKFIEEHGRKPTLTENNYLSVSTRSVKMKSLSRDKVREYQMAQLSEEEQAALEKVLRSAHRDRWIIFHSHLVAEESLRQALSLVYERESVVKLDKVLAEALNQNLGMVNLETLKKTAASMPELRNLGGLAVNPWVSPEEVIEREIYAVEAVEEQKDVFEPIEPDFTAFPGEASREKQSELVHGILNSKDRFNLFRGVAGAGKTSTLQELCRGLRSGGLENIHLIAPTNSATDVLKQEGFEQSQTVAAFLLSQKKPPAGSYVIIDESGLNSLREGVELIKTARGNNYRVLFVGDARQHTAVESGDFFRLLEDHSKIERFSLSDIYRQQNEEYRRGISECALGKFEAAFERFDRNGFIHEGKTKYLEEAATSYMEYTENGEFIDRSLLVAPTHEEGDKLTDAVRAKLKASGSVASSGKTAKIFRTWSKPKAWLKDSVNYAPGTVIAFIRNMKDIGRAGETATVECSEDGMLYLDNGKCLYAKAASDFIEAGELREIELCRGDLIQFNVNLRDRKIYNGNIAQVTDTLGKVMLLYPDGKPRELIDMPPGYSTFKYGWVTTSHKAQGRTAETVVVAAQALDRKAFYVALSRGRSRVALHCPEKEFLKQQLSFRIGDRLSVHDLAGDGQIAPDNLLPLSEDARSRKTKTLPDTTYKSIAERARKLMKKIKRLAGNLLSVKRKISARRARNRKYGFGIVTEEIKLEIEHQNALAAIEEQQAKEARAAEIRRMLNPPEELSPYQEAMKKIAEMEKRNSTPVKKEPVKEDIVYPIPNPQPRESTVSKPVSDSLTVIEKQKAREARAAEIERMLNPPKELSPYQEAMKKIAEMEKRNSTPVKKEPVKEDIVYPVPNPRPRESTVSKPVSDTPVLPTGKRHRGLESLERMKAQEKPQLSPYEEALQKMKEFEMRDQESHAAEIKQMLHRPKQLSAYEEAMQQVRDGERRAAEERAKQEKLARETAAREQAVEAARLEAERKERTASQMIHDMVSEPIKPHQLKILEKKIADNLLHMLTSEQKTKLTQGDYSRLLRESREFEAAKKGAASQMNNNLAGKPIKPHQLMIIEKKIAANLLSPLTSEEKSKLTQSDFSRLLKESRERIAAVERAEQEKLAREAAEERARQEKLELEQMKRELASPPASNSQMKVLDDLREQGKIQEIPENLTKTAASKMINDALADESIAPQQLAILEKKIADYQLPLLTSEEKTNLTQGDFTRLLEKSRECSEQDKLNEMNRRVESCPASDSQLKVLDELREQGKIQEIPENMTRVAASKMINDALADEPIAPQQLAIIEKKIDRNELPPLTSEEKTRLTQGDYSRLLKESLRRSRETSSLRPTPVTRKKPSRGMDL